MGVDDALNASLWSLSPTALRSMWFSLATVVMAGWVTVSSEGFAVFAGPLRVYALTVSVLVFSGVVDTLVTVIITRAPATVAADVALPGPLSAVLTGPPLLANADSVGVKFAVAEVASEIVGTIDTASTLVVCRPSTGYAVLGTHAGVELAVDITPSVVTFTVAVVFVSCGVSNAHCAVAVQRSVTDVLRFRGTFSAT